MNVTDTIKSRRSVRSYLSKPVPKEIIQELIDLANLAPTAGNKENREFIVITEQKTKEALDGVGCTPQYRITVLITLGYIKNPPYPQKRKPSNELTHWEKW